MGNLKVITAQMFDPEYFKEFEAYNVKTIVHKQPNCFCVDHGACILTYVSNEVLKFSRFSKTEKEWINFKVSIKEYISGNAKIVRLVPETSEDSGSSTITGDKYNGDLSHYTDILGNITPDQCIQNQCSESANSISGPDISKYILNKKKMKYTCFHDETIPDGKIYVSDIPAGKEAIIIRYPYASESSIVKLQTCDKSYCPERMKTIKDPFAIINTCSAMDLLLEMDDYGDIIFIMSDNDTK